MGSAAQHSALQHFPQNFNLCPAGRHPASDMFVSSLCCTLTSCWGNLCIASHILHFDSNGQNLDLKHGSLELGTHEACFALRIMKKFCYLCGFLFLKGILLCFLCLLTYPHQPVVKVCCYSYTSKDTVSFLNAMTILFLCLLPLVALPTTSLSLKLMAKYLLPVLALSLVLSCTANSYSKSHKNSRPQHTSSLFSQ